MSSWIFSIRDTERHNAEIAFQHQIWGMTSHQKVKRDDTVYFWLSKLSLVAMARATSDAYPSEGGSWPWNDGKDYTWRFDLQLVSESPHSEPSWGELQQQLGFRSGPNVKPRFHEPRQEAILASYFAAPTEPLRFAPDRIDVSALEDDRRRWDHARRANREGQGDFRALLERTYGMRCAVTGSTVAATLDAVHLSRFLGAHTHVPENGLLLRTDIHRLYDRGLLDITDDLQVALAPALAGDPTYGHLDGQHLRIPASGPRPSSTALQLHRAQVRA